MAIPSLLMTRHPRSGLSLVELLVAMALLSLVMGMGFAATSAMQRGYLVEAGLAADQLETTTSLRQIISQFHNDSDFIRNPPLVYPPDDPDTEIIETRFSVVPVRGRQAGIRPSGAQGGAEPCLIERLTLDPMGIRVTVENSPCLLPAATASLSHPPATGMIRLPRLMVITTDRRHRQDTMLVEAATALQPGIALKREAGTISADGMEWQRKSQRDEDHFGNRTVNLMSFGGQTWLAVSPDTGINRQHRAFSLVIETPFDDTKVMSDCQSAEHDHLTQTGLNYEGLTTLLDHLCFRHQGRDKARLLITIRGCHLQWRRLVRLNKVT